MTVLAEAIPVALVPDWSAEDRAYTAYWNVLSDDPSDGGPDLLTSAGLPNYGDSLSFDGQTDDYSFCIRLSHERVEMGAASDEHPTGTHVFRVTARYSSRIAPPGNKGNPATPWVGKVPEWAFPSKEYQIAVEKAHKDAYSNPLVPVENLAKQPYDPPLVMTYKNRLIQVTWWSQSVNLAAVDLFQGRVNHSPFWGFDTRRLRINDLQFAVVYEYGTYFSENRAEIEICNNPHSDYTWLNRVLEVGDLTYDATHYRWELPKDDFGQTHTVRVRLNENGGRLAADADPIYTDWYVEDEVEFSGLNLPDFPSHIVY